MSIHGVFTDKVQKSSDLARNLLTDDMTRYMVLPETKMIYKWPDDNSLKWVIVDSTYPAQISTRYELLLNKRDMVIDRLPGEDMRAAEFELRDTVVDYVLNTYPDYFSREGDLILSPLAGLAIDIGPNGADPLVAIALLASEDMLLLLPQKYENVKADLNPDDKIVAGLAHMLSASTGRAVDGRMLESVKASLIAKTGVLYPMKGGALLFPHDWGLRSHFNTVAPDSTDADAYKKWEEARNLSLIKARMGKTPHEIHNGRVAHYMENFATRVDQFFAQMPGGMKVWRRNWGPTMGDDLYRHSDEVQESGPEMTSENWEKFGFMRAEHEGFLKLHKTEAVVFSIKTYVHKLSEMARNPVVLAAMIAGNDNLKPKMFDYRADRLPAYRVWLHQYRPKP